MAKLIREQAANQYFSESKYWLIGNRFELMISMGKDRCSFFIEDKKKQIHSLQLTPKVGKDLGLFEEPDIKLSPSIDTCSISVPRSRHDEIFKLIENYLLELVRSQKI